MFKTNNVWLLLGFCLLSKDTDFTASTDSPNRGFLEDYYFCHDHHTTSRLLVNVLVEVIKQNTVKTFFTSDFGCIGKTDVSTFSIGVTAFCLCAISISNTALYDPQRHNWFFICTVSCNVIRALANNVY